MPTVSPWDAKYQRPAPKRHTRTFTLPDGGQLSLTLLELDTPSLGVVADEAQNLIARFIGVPGLEAPPTVLPDGTPLRPSRTLCYEIAALMVAQVPESGDQWPEGEWKYSFLDWVGVMRCWPKVWRQIRAFSNEVGAAAEGGDPNSPEAGTGTGSDSSTSTGTLN